MNKSLNSIFRESVRQSLKIMKHFKDKDILKNVVDISGKVVTTTVVSTGALSFIFGDDRTKNTDPYEDKLK